MNLRLFVIATVISAITIQSHAAGAELSLNKGDFIAAEKVNSAGEIIVKVKLSKSGKAKVRKLNRQAVGKEVHSEIAGVKTDFVLRVPIDGDSIQMGPYSEQDAAKVTAEINK